ncbi:Glucanosyltransferase-domain-containing protein [Zychaea mexicana]|uniref:Glucanosyltransferase-domain-containing protein n=1 Tax=Zychaea mexicana TaxID=64656 RepID=UPI0022FE4EF6|nr:Glucanosyltransferase-domain-containing protein [Zychaea mexicana]KAI9490649.1 Glucanosyltransferase-domain-containing protein [Zychaea mexicana]
MQIAALGVLLLLYVATVVHALHPIVIKGNKLFDSVTKNQFFIKGVAYQPRDGHVVRKDNFIADPLADASACARDASLMQKLGMNVVRVYEVDPSKDHDQCMKSFADAGIYLLLDIATPKFSINRKSPEYDTRLYEAYRKTVDAFSKYDNMLAFIAGNEVTNDKTNTQASAYVKAAIRDMKKYIKSTKKRYIPIGYASNDDEFIRDAIKDYFVCGEEDEQADFFGVNMYEWCGDSSYEKSGYKDRTKEFESYHRPVFLSEYGCNLVTPREFSDVEVLYGSQMTDVWSGGVVYEWTQENNNYGLVKIANGKAELMQDYTNLQKALAKASPKGVNMDAYNDQRQAPQCPEHTQNWKAATTLPPTPSSGACSCMRDTLSCTASDQVSNTVTSGGGHSNSSVLGDQIDVLCGMVTCDDISGDGEKGHYGAFSFCSGTEKLSWLYNLYMEKNKGGRCEFNGNAEVTTPKRKDVKTCADIQANVDSTNDGSSGDSKSAAVSWLQPSSFISWGLLMTGVMVLTGR